MTDDQYDVLFTVIGLHVRKQYNLHVHVHVHRDNNYHCTKDIIVCMLVYLWNELYQWTCTCVNYLFSLPNNVVCCFWFGWLQGLLVEITGPHSRGRGWWRCGFTNYMYMYTWSNQPLDDHVLKLEITCTSLIHWIHPKDKLWIFC